MPVQQPCPLQSRVSFSEPITAAGVLIVSPWEEDHIRLRSILGNPRWSLHSASGWQEARALLPEVRASVIVCERDLIDGDWKDVLTDPVRLALGAPIVVISRCADEDLWLNVLDSGGHDVLVRPFDATEVIRVIRMACQGTLTLPTSPDLAGDARRLRFPHRLIRRI